MADRKTPKKDTPITFPSITSSTMTVEEARAEFDRFFKEIEKEVGEIPDVVLEQGAQKVIDLLEGRITWAEMRGISKERMLQMTEAAYLQIQAGRLDDAEHVLKTLTLLDWENSVYHQLLGSVYQRQKKYGDAVIEYSEAIRNDPNDFVSLTNRAEILFTVRDFKDAEIDCDAVMALNLKAENKWLKRAQFLKIQMAKAKGDAIKKVTPEKKKK